MMGNKKEERLLNLVVGIEQILKLVDPNETDPYIKRIMPLLREIHTELIN